MSDEPVKPDPEKKPKRPRDANQLAKRIVDLATGEAEEKEPEPSDRSEAGRKGAAARSQALTAEQRSDIARKAAAKRWSENG